MPVGRGLMRAQREAMPLGDRDDAVPSLSRSSDSRLTRLDRTFPAATSTCEGIRTLYPPLFVLATPSFPLPATTPGLVVDRGSKRKGKSSTRNEVRPRKAALATG